MVITNESNKIEKEPSENKHVLPCFWGCLLLITNTNPGNTEPDQGKCIFQIAASYEDVNDRNSLKKRWGS